MFSEQSSSTQPARKRLRISHACDLCRARKIRCDGKTPCAPCTAFADDCTYGAEVDSRGKSDYILEGVLRVERLLHELKSEIALRSEINTTSSQQAHSPSSFSGSTAAKLYRPHGYRPSLSSRNEDTLENAILEQLHLSTTESILHWPQFEAFTSLKNSFTSVFDLEQSRTPMRVRSTLGHPFIDSKRIDDVLGAFERKLNFWYPTLSRVELVRMRSTMNRGFPEDDGTDTCLALLAMALGCASLVVEGLVDYLTPSREESLARASNRALGDLYFESATKKLHAAHSEVNTTATHCLLFTGLYFAFLRRPLQAWECINSAATKCLLLLSYRPQYDDAPERERLHRIFWSCYILEGDYLAELSGVPESGLARVESSIPLPGALKEGTTGPTLIASTEEEQSLLYFLACISMRRLLNRVHQLLYARGTGAAFSLTGFPSVLTELNQQLEAWREVLPKSFAFSVSFECEPAVTEESSFLRQRYLTCRSVIHRPYLMWVLSQAAKARDVQASPDAPAPISQEIRTSSKICIDSCLLHILNLKGFAQTVMVDTWICSLSMAGAMLVLLAAYRTASLQDLVPSEILVAGSHLRRLFATWQEVCGNPRSPSVDQAVEIIREVDKLLAEQYTNGAS